MATKCPVSFDTNRLRSAVVNTYERLARDPSGDFHFHRGAAYATSRLRYDARELATLPAVATDRFAGVGNPLRAGPIWPGEIVLDHACGAGMDLLLAARRVGPTGRAIGIDLTPGMRARAREAARLAGLSDVVDVREGAYEALPLADASVDVVISNGVVNLAPDKQIVFREIARVLKPGGRLYLADVVVRRELTLAARETPDLWAACVAGALPIHELPFALGAAGFEDVQVLERFDAFAATSAEAKVSHDLDVHAVNVRAHKSDSA